MRAAPDEATASAIAAAAADLLTATADAWEGRRGGPLTDAAELFDRAARELRPRSPGRRTTHVVELRATARLIALMGVISDDKDAADALRLIYTLAAMAEHLADLRESQQRLHQARAAREVTALLRADTRRPHGLAAGRRLPFGPPPQSAAPVSHARPRASGR
jgi:hypothetical protein